MKNKLDNIKQIETIMELNENEMETVSGGGLITLGSDPLRAWLRRKPGEEPFPYEPRKIPGEEPLPYD